MTDLIRSRKVASLKRQFLDGSEILNGTPVVSDDIHNAVFQRKPQLLNDSQTTCLKIHTIQITPQSAAATLIQELA